MFGRRGALFLLVLLALLLIRYGTPQEHPEPRDDDARRHAPAREPAGNPDLHNAQALPRPAPAAPGALPADLHHAAARWAGAVGGAGANPLAGWLVVPIGLEWMAGLAPAANRFKVQYGVLDSRAGLPGPGFPGVAGADRRRELLPLMGGGLRSQDMLRDWPGRPVEATRVPLRRGMPWRGR